MEKPLLIYKKFIAILLLILIQRQAIQAQCTNSDFETGNLSGWTGTYGNGTCTGILSGTQCSGCFTPDPYQHNSLNQGPNNQPANGNAGFNHFVMASGFDPIVGGTILPVVYSPGSFSMRLGDAHANDAGHGGGESISYRFTVTPNNCNFIYHYAVVLKDGGHSTGQQPYFKIGMVDDNNNPINCATFDVDATTAQTIGGFVTVGSISYKTWSTVSIPLNNYIGQSVTITFTTRDCAPNGCEGSHWAYAYIDADCGPLQIAASSQTICNGQTITLTAPVGEASYSWSGPGIVSGSNSQQCVVNLPGNYTVNMTTVATTPCVFSLVTTIGVSPYNLSANFSVNSLCAGMPTSFTDISTPAGNASNWAWDFNNDGTTDATTQNPSYTFTTAGTYPIHLSVSSPPCIADTIINVVVSPLPTSSFTVTSPVCAYASAAINYTGTASSGATFNWSFDGGTIVSGSGQGPYQINWSTSGTKNISLTVTSNGCTSSVTTVPIVVNPLPVISISPNVAICTGASTTLTASGANTYSWTPSSGLSNTSGSSVIASPASTATYLVTGNSLGCTDTASVTVTVNPIPVVTVSPDIAICAGASATLSASGATTYLWSPAVGSSSSVIVTPTSTTTYSVTGTTLGCTDSASVTVSIKPIPTSSFTTTSPVCAGINSLITYTGITAANSTYNWSFDGGTVVSGIGAGPYQVNWLNSGTKNITLTVTSNGCTSPVTTVPVTVNAIPVVTLSPDIAICAGASATLSASGAVSYLWSPVIGSGSSVIVTPASTTTYSVTGTTLGCSDSASVTVSIKPIPTSSFTTTSPVCAGVNSLITYTGITGANSTYNWSFAGGTVVSGIDAGPYQVNWLNSGTKNITLSVTSNGCTSPVTTVPVIVNAIPVVTLSPDVAVCAGASATLTASGATTYLWSPAVGSGSSVTVTPASTTTYSVTGTTLGCSDSASVTVSIKPIPTSSFTTTSPVCAGINSLITYTGITAANSTYNWGFAGGTIVSGIGAGPYQVNWLSSGTKNISLTVTSNGCTSPVTTVPVTVNAIPVVTVSPDIAICAGASATLSASGATTYLWSPAVGSGSSVTVTPASTTTYSVTGTTLGCSDSASVTVSIKPIPTSSFSTTSPVCVGVNSLITYTGITSANSIYNWNFSGGTVVSGIGAGPYQVNWLSNGTKNITLTVTSNGCTSPVTTVPVTVNAIPVVTVSPDVAICAGENTSLAATGAVTFSWYPASSLNSASGVNVTATPAATTTYTVTGTSEGCSATADVTVNVTPVPVAAFAPVTGQCFAYNSFNFHATGTYLPSATFAWSFGANAIPVSSTSQNQQVSFSSSGNNNISLIITQNGCVSNAFSDVVSVYPMPVVNFTADTLLGCQNLPVCFSDNSTGTGPLVYQWNFGDGHSSASANPCHNYANAGTYDVTLHVTSADGCKDDSLVQDMVRIIANPLAAFTLSSTTIQLPATIVDIQNESQHALTYLWQLGNLGTSSVENPGATSFTEPGEYPIMLYAYNELGCVDSAQHAVTVYQEEVLFVPNAFTPNGDGNNDYFEIYGKKDGWKQIEVMIFDRWGEKVFESNDMNFKWDGVYKGEKMMEGVYVYLLNIVYTNNHSDKIHKGSVTMVR